MRYIEVEGKCKIEYDVEMDEEKLEEILVSLNRECYVIKYGKRFEMAHTEKEAHEKIRADENMAGEKENIDYRITSFEEPVWYSHGDRYVANYDAVYKGSVGLTNIIYNLLEHKDSEKKDYNRSIIEKLQNYGNSIDFIPFEKRIEIASEQLEQAIAENNGVLKAVEKYGEATIEARLNRNFNFKRLMELYKETLSCLKINMIDDTILYNLRNK